MQAMQNNHLQGRVELYQDGNLVGFIQYRMDNGQIWLLHTLISTRCRDLSLVDDLLRRALQDLQRRRIDVLPFCPVVRHYMTVHPRYMSLLPKTMPGHFPSISRSSDAKSAQSFRTVPAAEAVPGWAADGLARGYAFLKVRREPLRKRAQQRRSDKGAATTTVDGSKVTAVVGR